MSDGALATLLCVMGIIGWRCIADALAEHGRVEALRRHGCGGGIG